MEQELKKYFETRYSALAVLSKKDVSDKEAREYSCNDIANNLTPIHQDAPQITELDEGQNFCYLIRVDTTDSDYNYKEYMSEFRTRNFISFSTITEKNISHYKTNKPFVFAYNVPAEAIVHVFPFDANTYTRVKKEEDLSYFPSFWLKLDDLNALTDVVGRYNQITCKTKIKGKIIRPAAVIVFDKSNQEAEEVAKRFNLPIIITHPNKDAINFVGDACDDSSAITRLASVLTALYGQKFKQPKDKEVYDALMKEIELMAFEYLH